jgi:very-short-patch-repair endonuclease
MERDRERDLTLRVAGYSVLRYMSRQLKAKRAMVAADIRGVLRLRSKRVPRGHG